MGYRFRFDNYISSLGVDGVMSGNRYSVLIKMGVFEYRVTVEFTSYMKGMACFKIIEPLESQLQNIRIKIPEQEQQNILWIFREVFHIMATQSSQNHKKWTDKYRDATGEVSEMEPLSCEEQPTADSEEPTSPYEHWLKVGRYDPNATPPNENWVWGAPIKQWYKQDMEKP